jgi:hypothetical protein
MQLAIKWNIDLVREFVEENGDGDKLISDVYKNEDSILTINCHLCNKNFETKWKNYSKCCKHTKCIYVKRKVAFSYNEVKEYIESKGCELLSKEYIDNSHMLEIKCNCKNIFITSFATFKDENKITCDECTNDKIRKERSFSLEEVNTFLMEKNYILLNKEYKNCLEKIDIENIITGYRYFVKLVQATRTDKLYEFAPNNKYRDYNFNIWIKNNNSKFTLVNFINKKGQSRVKLKCNNCKETWDAYIGNVFKGQGCPCCNHRLANSINNLLILFPEICLDWDYNKNELYPNKFLPGSNVKVWWKCHKCKYEWFTGINGRTGFSTGCPKCSRSKGEKIVENFLFKNDIIYEPQYRFIDCRYKYPLPFDFAIFYDNEKKNLKEILEYDGELHYMPYHKKNNSVEKLAETQRNDEIKTKYCIDKNIRLIRIPYWEKNNIETILTKELNL